MTQQNKTPAVSVVVPIYNVDQFLRRCLESLAVQTLPDVEVILVNDGSTDSSLSIMKEFEEKHPLFHVVDKENGGVSSARNAGVDAATGEFIAFVDSDDFISPDYLSHLYRAAKENGADIACCDFTFYFPETGRTRKRRNALRRGVFPAEKALRWMLSDVTMRYFLWNKLWRRTLFTDHNIKFPLRYFEDSATAPQLMYFADKVVIIKEYGYYYTQHKASILGSISADKINDHIRSAGVVRNFFAQQNGYEPYRNRFYWYARKATFTNWYNITWAHLCAHTTNGYWKNLRGATKALRYLSSSRFQTVSGVDELPRPVIEPMKKSK